MGAMMFARLVNESSGKSMFPEVLWMKIAVPRGFA